MLRSRRTLLRDAALLSAGAAIAPLTAGARSGQTAVSSTPPPFAGFRVFFEGAWLFCDDRNGGMYAISREMNPGPGYLPHTFPYGVWQQPGFDQSHPSLRENPKAVNGEARPYLLTLKNYKAPGSSCTKPFSDAVNHASGPFNYLMNSDKSIQVNLKCGRLRVIALPIPSKIIPLGFVPPASIQDASGKLLAKRNSQMPVCVDKGLPTTHVFEYAGAEGLQFETPSDELSLQPGSMNLHFHSVPIDSYDPHARTDHGPAMFSNLLEVLQTSGAQLSGLTYSNPSPGAWAVPGADAKILGIQNEELEILTFHPMNSDLASCAAGGLGVG
jgi:hypothetical protein